MKCKSKVKIGKPCNKCGGNTYYKSRNVCITCWTNTMDEINGQKLGWPKIENHKVKMVGVRYDLERTIANENRGSHEFSRK